MSFFGELQRRNVFRVGAAYAAVSWLAIQIAETTFPAFGFGDGAVRIVIILAALGLIPALILSWAFELTPEGFKRDWEVDRASPVARRMRRRLDRLVMVVLALALGYFAFDKFVLAPQRVEEELAAATEVGREAGRSEAIVESYGDKSIAVLPFTDMSPEGDQAYFADGIAEELLSVLSRYDDLRVISRSSTFALRDAGLSTPELAAKLHTGHVLEGSVRKAGERVRITAQLIEARTDTHLWSETYDRQVDDIFLIQDEIAAKVAQALKARLVMAAPAATTDPATYELYLRGIGLLAQRGYDNLTEATVLFEDVTSRDPDFAPGYAALAQAHYWRGAPDEDRYTRIEDAANHALALDPDNSEALALIGRLRLGHYQTDEGRALLERSIESNANNPLGYRWLGQSYATSDPARYVALARKAWLVDPLDPTIHWQRVKSLGLLGRTDEALDVAQSRLSFDPDDELVYGLAGDTHWRAGELDRAVKSYYVAYRAYPDTGPAYAVIQDVFADSMGEVDLAVAWSKELERRTGFADHWGIITLHKKGRTEEALQLAAEQASDQQRGLYLGFLTVRMTHDLERARQYYDEGFAAVGLDPRIFTPDLYWVHYIDYALILQRAGDVSGAADLISQIQAYFDRQIADGIEVAYTEDHLQFLYAKLRGIAGDATGTVAALQRALREGHRCVGCLRFPHFDTVRDDPGFVAVVEEYEKTISSYRQRLADEGMLLTPEQVVQLQDFSFDPFVR